MKEIGIKIWKKIEAKVLFFYNINMSEKALKFGNIAVNKKNHAFK